MALYTAPTVPDLAAKIRRALRDPAEAVFEDAQIIDFINQGLSDLSLIRPLETLVVVNDEAGLAGTMTDPDATSVTDLDSVWAVELIGVDGTKHDGLQTYIMPDDPTTNWRNGWDFVGGTITLPHSILDPIIADWESADPSYLVHVRGYRHRRAIGGDLNVNDDVLDLYSLPEEQAVVFVAQKSGFEALLNDRALFQQWQTATGATDISPNQLSQMVYGAQQNWERLRQHLRIIRRQPVGAQ